jgi:hypothetical protein
VSFAPTPESSPAQEVPSLSEAKEAVKKALEALSVMNKLQVENIHFNKHEFKDPDTPMPKEVPALDTITVSGNVTK